MSTKRLHILVVEDQRATREFLVETLTSLGHWVESCPNGTTALDRMSHDGLDVLLTEAWLPDANGFNYLSELFERGKLPPRVISMSENGAVEHRQQSKLAGCIEHLVKPVKLQELKTVFGSP